MDKISREVAGHDEAHGDQLDLITDILAARLLRGLVYQGQEKSEGEAGQTLSSGIISQSREAQVVEAEGDALSVTPSSLMDTCGPSISTHPHPNLSSFSSSSVLCLTPPLPPTVELAAVLADTRLTLDVYKGGAAALSLLWASISEQLKGIQYLTLGSEDEPALNDALGVLPHLTDLHTLTIRGTSMMMMIIYR